jgi:hypothetical protein
MEIATGSALGIVATLEFIQHQLPKMGHGKPPVTRGLHSQQSPRIATPQRPSRQRLSSNDEALIKTFPDVVQTVFVEQKKNIGTSHSSAGTQFPSFGYMGQM